MEEYSEQVEEELAVMKQVISHNLKRYRKLQKVSQQELADICGLHRTYISDLENSKCNPTLGVVVALSCALKISISQLLEHDNY